MSLLSCITKFLKPQFPELSNKAQGLEPGGSMNDGCCDYYVCSPGRSQINDELNIATNKLGTRKEVLDLTKILLKHKLSLINSFKEKKA